MDTIFPYLEQWKHSPPDVPVLLTYISQLYLWGDFMHVQHLEILVIAHVP